MLHQRWNEQCLSYAKAGWRRLHLPARTSLPFSGSDEAVTVVVDDENVRLAAHHDHGGRVPDYGRLARVCREGFRAVALHIFSVREMPAPRVQAGDRCHVHRKVVPGKNVDMELAVWVAEQLRIERSRRLKNLICVTGDQDYLALHALGQRRGARVGFIATPGPSVAGAILRLAPGLLGADVLRWATPRMEEWS